MVTLVFTVNNNCWRSSRSLVTRARSDILILCSARLLAFESPITFNYFRMRSQDDALILGRLHLFLRRKLNGAWYDKEVSTQKESTIKMFTPPHAELSIEKRKETGNPVVGSRVCIAHYSVLHAIFQSYSASLGRSR